MDKQVLGLFIPILALAIPAAAIVFRGLERIAKLRLEEAKARAGLGGGDMQGVLAQVDDLRRELEDVQARLDFAERMLARGAPERDQLPRAPGA